MATRIGKQLSTCLAAVVTAAVAAFFAAAPASAYTVDRDWTAADYAIGFPPPADGGAGPLGLAFDRSGNLFVSDIASGTLYRIPPGGGHAPAYLLRSGLGQPEGLTLDLGGRLYMARSDTGSVEELDPGSGATKRTLVAGLPCPTALATDPLSGDVFASNKCNGGAIMRIGPVSGNATSTQYTATSADGLTFAPDGTLFAAAGDRVVARIDGTSSATPGAATKVAELADIDGIAYVPAIGGSPPFLVVNRNNGEIDRVELDGSSSPILTGASRGDLVTVGPDDCIYAAFSDRIVKLGPASGACTASPPAGIAPSSASGIAVLGARELAKASVLDLALKGRAPRRIRRGRRFTYTLKVTNRGPAVANKVVLLDRVPKGLRVRGFGRRRPAGCKRAPGRLWGCFVKRLAPSKSFTMRLQVTALRGRRYVNRAAVKSSNLDRVPGNNNVKLVTRVLRARARH
jgi:uncharacterized repeat protein (TIGR01451 family)